ncbi:MAG: hypothetical protein GPOALKHO_001193 [Sodalis sp.]|nr:MAG: hypothetical protein GPOALKHO_001193 [Sodalis sp.]
MPSRQHPLDNVQRRSGGSHFGHPKYVAVIGVLLHYLIQGADYIHPDTVGYLWKEVDSFYQFINQRAPLR